MIKKNIFKIIVPLLISGLALYWAGLHVDWHQLSLTLRQAKVWPFFLALPIWVIAFWLRGVRWKILLDPFQVLPCRKLIGWQVGALFINSILPFRMGEVARAWWVGHKTSIPKSTVFSTIFVERIFDIGALFILSLGILMFLGLEKLGNKFSLPLYGAILGLLLGLAVAFKMGWINQIVALLVARLPHKLQNFAAQFMEGFAALKDGPTLFKIAALSFMVWAVDIGVLAILSRSVALNLSWLKAGFLVIGLILGVMIPAAPGAVGTYEAGGAAALSLLGYDLTLALSFIFLLHVFQFALFTVIGLPVLIAEGFNPKTMFNEAPEKVSADAI